MSLETITEEYAKSYSYLISEMEKYVWNAMEKLKGLQLILRIRDIKVRLPSAVKQILSLNSKLLGETKKSCCYLELHNLGLKGDNQFISNLCGHIFRSSSDGLRSKSMQDLSLISPRVRGGGLSSIFQILFRANPCCSRFPRAPNYIHNETNQ